MEINCFYNPPTPIFTNQASDQSTGIHCFCNLLTPIPTKHRAADQITRINHFYNPAHAFFTKHLTQLLRINLFYDSLTPIFTKYLVSGQIAGEQSLLRFPHFYSYKISGIWPNRWKRESLLHPLTFISPDYQTSNPLTRKQHFRNLRPFLLCKKTMLHLNRQMPISLPAASRLLPQKHRIPVQISPQVARKEHSLDIWNHSPFYLFL